jgi:hypothetical protein
MPSRPIAYGLFETAPEGSAPASGALPCRREEHFPASTDLSVLRSGWSDYDFGRPRGAAAALHRHTEQDRDISDEGGARGAPGRRHLARPAEARAPLGPEDHGAGLRRPLAAATRRRAGAKPRTRESYDATLRLHILPVAVGAGTFSDLPVSTVRRPLVTSSSDVRRRRLCVLACVVLEGRRAGRRRTHGSYARRANTPFVPLIGSAR